MTQHTPIPRHHTPPVAAVTLWDRARAAYFEGGFPSYGTIVWRGLPLDAPQRLAAVLDAAERWRLHVAEQARLDALMDEDPEAWFREVTADANEQARRTLRRLRLSSVPTATELAERRRPRPALPVEAGPGWTPIAVPGRPGWWRHHLHGRQIDLPHRHAPTAEVIAA